MAASKTEGQLTKGQQSKLDGVVGSLKIPAKQQVNLARFANKYLRYKLGIRGTGPHAHGFSTAQRKTIREAINAAFGIKAAERKPAAPKAKAAPKPKTTRKPAGRKPASRKRGSVPSTAQLARQQAARAAQTGSDVPGAVVVRRGR